MERLRKSYFFPFLNLYPIFQCELWMFHQCSHHPFSIPFVSWKRTGHDRINLYDCGDCSWKVWLLMNWFAWDMEETERIKDFMHFRYVAVHNPIDYKQATNDASAIRRRLAKYLLPVIFSSVLFNIPKFFEGSYGYHFELVCFYGLINFFCVSTNFSYFISGWKWFQQEHCAY